ncbi:hypothetical protein Hte_003940 [Hypoxylon texense]
MDPTTALTATNAVPMDPRSCLERLPVELQWAVLGLLTDVRSLANAALSCRALYVAFKANEDDLVTAVLTNCVGPEVIREVMLIHQCRPPLLSTEIKSFLFSPQNELTLAESRQVRSYTRNFTRDMKSRRVPAATKVSMVDAIDLADLHLRVVVPLMKKFIRVCAFEPITFPGKDLAESLQERPATRLEKERIIRALYRFELFRKLFGRYGDRVEQMPPQTDIIPDAFNYFKRFSAWEIVQMGTIHDFLGRMVLPAFADLAEHDVEYGALALDFLTPWNGRISHPAIQHLLSTGLRSIHEISMCVSFKASVDKLGPSTMENRFFFDHALRYQDSGAQISPRLFRLLHGKAFHADGDPAPKAMLQKVLGNRYPLFDERDWLDRRWGFLMWDGARYEELGIAKKEDRHCWSRSSWPEAELPWHLVHETLQERSLIWHEGGKGYWSPWDQSRVVYPEGRQPVAFYPPINNDDDDDDDDDGAAAPVAGPITVPAPAQGRAKEPWYHHIARRVFGRKK